MRSAHSAWMLQRECLDVGSSTGGFVDCLLQQGAARVIAVDVGRGQLDARLRNDSRVSCREGRQRPPTPKGGPTFRAQYGYHGCVVHLRGQGPRSGDGLWRPSFEGVLLVKPQFEAGPSSVGKKGIVRDPEVHVEVLTDDCVRVSGWDWRLRACAGQRCLEWGAMWSSSCMSSATMCVALTLIVWADRSIKRSSAERVVKEPRSERTDQARRDCVARCSGSGSGPLAETLSVCEELGVQVVAPAGEFDKHRDLFERVASVDTMRSRVWAG